MHSTPVQMNGLCRVKDNTWAREGLGPKERDRNHKEGKLRVITPPDKFTHRGIKSVARAAEERGNRNRIQALITEDPERRENPTLVLNDLNRKKRVI